MALSTLLDAARLGVQQHLHRMRVVPIIVVYLNNICDSRCISCSIWKNNELLKIPSERQMPDSLLGELYESLGQWRPRQILLSGGEPVLHPKFGEAVRQFRQVAPQVGVITNGLLLGTCAPSILENIQELYISFDAPDAEAYRRIRGVDGYARLANSMKVVNGLRLRPRVVARCTLQHENAGRIPELVAAAKDLGFDAISFLAVDTGGSAFARDEHGAGDVNVIQPTAADLAELERHILSVAKSPDPFIEGGVERLQRIRQYFRALLGNANFPPIHCNAPWVSMVIETTGKIRGCFFQPTIGDFRTVNGETAMRFRRQLNVGTDATCERCVCSKYLGVRDFIRIA